MTFQLPTLDLHCSHDVPVAATSLPAHLDTSDAPGLAILEGGFRPGSGVYRFLQPDGLIALQLPDELPDLLRVVVRLRVDPQSDARWVTREERRTETPGPSDGPPVDRVPPGHHRLLRIIAQGRPKALVLLARGDGPEDREFQRVELDVPTREIDASHLLLLSLDAPPGTLGWNAAGRLAAPLVGTCIQSLRVSEETSHPRATVSTGLTGSEGWHPWAPQVGYAVVNPGAREHAVEVAVAPGQATSDPPPTAGPLRRLRSRVVGNDPLPEVQVVDVAGAPVAVESEESAGGLRVVVPAGVGPVYLRLCRDDESVATQALQLRATALAP